MKSVCLFLCCFLYFESFSVNAQFVYSALNNEYQPLAVGDKMPDYQLKNLINYPKQSTSINDFRGKLLIIEFWSSYCASCISAWPKLLELQKQFDGRIQILLFNSYEDSLIVKKLFQQRQKASNLKMTLPTVCRDTLIKQLFPFTSVPHMVWIDEKGFIQSITMSGSVNAKNIQKMLNKEPLKMVQSYDNSQVTHADANKPLFIDKNGGTPKKVYWNSVFGKADGRIGGALQTADSEYWGYHAIAMNTDIKMLYQLAYGYKRPYLNGAPGIDKVTNSRTILEVADTSRYVLYIDDELIEANQYAYQLLPPRPVPIELLQQRMKEDLKLYIGLEARWEKRKVPCLVLTCDDTMLLKKNTGPVLHSNTTEKAMNHAKFFVNRLSVEEVIVFLESFLRYYQCGPPIVDETGYKGLIDHVYTEGIDLDYTDYKAFNKALSRHKMKLTPGVRELDMLVISEPKGYQWPFEEK